MKITVNNIELAYEKFGDGEPLILLHGNGEDHHIFDVISKKLKDDFTIYAIDSRNHGESTKTEDYSYETMAKDIYSFIHTLNLGKVNIVGFSDGGIISLILAMNQGECINKMALLGVNLKPDDFTEESYQFIKKTYEETKSPLFRLMLEQPDIELADVKNVTTPTLVIGAEHDVFKPEMFADLTEALPNAELIIMNGHEHTSYIVDQDILYPDLVKFLGGFANGM
jgi:pimeloyl-ACP methyl ester carboxylesterase